MLDLCWGYRQVQIEEEDEHKRHGFYEFLVMPFGMTNALITFCDLMNQVSYDYIDDFVIVY